jgi:hypothetical protein
MKYLISNYGTNIAVGLLDKDTAEEDINLSHNLDNINVNDNYYNGVLSFPSYARFLRYLLNKEYLTSWQPNKTFREVLSCAKKKVQITLDNEVKYANFIPQIYQHEVARQHQYRVHEFFSPNKDDEE